MQMAKFQVNVTVKVDVAAVIAVVATILFKLL
jgi:hypothetical protein